MSVNELYNWYVCGVVPGGVHGWDGKWVLPEQAHPPSPLHGILNTILHTTAKEVKKFKWPCSINQSYNVHGVELDYPDII